MSEIKFYCLHCGQSLEAGTDMVGEMIECPTCQKSITIPVPLVPAEDDRVQAALVQKATMATPPPPQPKAKNPPKTQRETGKKNMLCGALLCIGGIIVTAITYRVASQNPTGGMYIIAWGSIMFGAIQFICGLAQTIQDPLAVVLHKTKQMTPAEAATICTAMCLICWKMAGTHLILGFAFAFVACLNIWWISRQGIPRWLALSLATTLCLVTVVFVALPSTMEQIAQSKQPQQKSTQNVSASAENARWTFLRDKALSLLPADERAFLIRLFNKPEAELTDKEMADVVAGMRKATSLLPDEEQKEFGNLSVGLTKDASSRDKNVAISAKLEQQLVGTISPAEMERIAFLREKALSKLPVDQRKALMLLYQKPINKLTKEEYDQRMLLTEKATSLLSEEERKELETLGRRALLKGSMK